METIADVHAANVGIISTARAQVFVNSGQTEEQARFIWDYTQSKAPGREMTYLVLTHHHLDHCFAASFFDERHALIYGHRSFGSCMAEMRKHLGANDYREMIEAFLKIDSDICQRYVGSVHPVSPHRHVGEETSIAINGEEVTVLHMPGHTECQLAVYHPKSRILFAGDAINERAGPVTIFSDASDWRRWVAGLEKLKKLGFAGLFIKRYSKAGQLFNQLFNGHFFIIFHDIILIIISDKSSLLFSYEALTKNIVVYSKYE